MKEYAGKKILDLGCGDLFFLKHFSKDKPETEFYAIDIAFDKDFIEAEKHSHIKLYDSLKKLPENNNLRFDLIILMDVVEHIENDINFLKHLIESPFVSSSTIFFITVPAYNKLFFSHDKFLGHFRRYSNRSIDNTTTEAGLRTIDKGYFFFSLLIPRLFQVWKEKLKGGKNVISGTGLTHWNKNKALTMILKSFLIFDFRIHKSFKAMGIRTPGLSNYIICKKHA